jgi:hypothetical protein
LKPLLNRKAGLQASELAATHAAHQQRDARAASQPKGWYMSPDEHSVGKEGKEPQKAEAISVEVSTEDVLFEYRGVYGPSRLPRSQPQRETLNVSD